MALNKQYNQSIYFRVLSNCFNRACAVLLSLSSDWVIYLAWLPWFWEFSFFFSLPRRRRWTKNLWDQGSINYAGWKKRSMWSKSGSNQSPNYKFGLNIDLVPLVLLQPMLVYNCLPVRLLFAALSYISKNGLKLLFLWECHVIISNWISSISLERLHFSGTFAYSIHVCFVLFPPIRSYM